MICSQCVHAPLEPLETLSDTTLARIKELLESNVAPHGIEKEQLAELMSRTQTFDVALDTQIFELNASVENLLAHKTQSKQRLLDLETILHPKRYIPPEILADIFDHAVSDAFDAPLDTVRDGRFTTSLKITAPHWVVSRVCSHWRRTALMTPRIWRFVHVCFNARWSDLSRTMFLNHFLRLSGDHALHVMAYGSKGHKAEAELAVLLLSSHRWRTAAFSFDCSVYRSWDAAHLTLTALTTLHVNIQVPEVGAPLIVRMGFPQLRVLSTDTPAAFLRLFSLGEAPIEAFEQPDCLDKPCSVSHVAPTMLLTYPLLHSAQFHLTRAVASSFYNTSQYRENREYLNMRVLRLSGTHIGRAHFFSKFIFPHLEELSFDDVTSGFGGDDTLSFPAPLIWPTGQQLKTLRVCLDADPSEGRKLIAFLRSTPALSYLELTFRARFDIDAMMKDILVEKHGLIPALARLVVFCEEGVEISYDFVQSISYRRLGAHMVARLDEVVVDHVVYVDGDVEAAFNALLGNGMTGGLEVQY